MLVGAALQQSPSHGRANASQHWMTNACSSTPLTTFSIAANVRVRPGDKVMWRASPGNYAGFQCALTPVTMTACTANAQHHRVNLTLPCSAVECVRVVRQRLPGGGRDVIICRFANDPPGIQTIIQYANFNNRLRSALVLVHLVAHVAWWLASSSPIRRTPKLSARTCLV